jgi:hypothetical protein
MKSEKKKKRTGIMKKDRHHVLSPEPPSANLSRHRYQVTFDA